MSCTQITLKGTMCKNKIKSNNLCWLHLAKQANPVKPPAPKPAPKAPKPAPKAPKAPKPAPKAPKPVKKTKAVPKSMEKFLDAQKGQYEIAKSELEAGEKHSHWIWFIFPQLKGLGTSALSNKYGIKDAKEAEEYMSVDVLRTRYLELVDITYDWLVKKNLDPYVFVGNDVVKLRSSLQLFQPILKSKKVDAILAKL